MCGMTNRTRETVIDMTGVLRKAAVIHKGIQVVALGAEGVRSLRTKIGRQLKVHDGRPRLSTIGYLAHHVLTFQNVRIDRAMRSCRTGAAEFARVIAAVAVGTENGSPSKVGW